MDRSGQWAGSHTPSVDALTRTVGMNRTAQPSPSVSSPARIRRPADIPRMILDRRCDVLSIDLFDTLVYRRCARPSSVFELQFEAIRQFLPQIPNSEEWKRLRMDAERAAAARYVPYEIHFDEIYGHLALELDLDSDVIARLKAAELKAEEIVIAPFDDVVLAVNDLLDAGIVVVVNTDMYLPASWIRSLISALVSPRVQLLCSSETRSPKRTGLGFERLKEQFPGRRILHVGDNPHSDVKMANRHGVDAVLVDWTRPRWLQRNAAYSGYLGHMGVHRLSTPVDQGATASANPEAELAWRWSITLFDFLLALRDYAKDADEIWFLSRDGESLHEALGESPDFFGRPTRYVYTSRVATYPLFALCPGTQFDRVSGRPASESDRTQGAQLLAAYRSLIGASTRRIVLVDAGWKGRLQSALQTLIPEVDFRGYYFSLDPAGETIALQQSHRYIPWDPGLICGAAVEALLGYRGPGCRGYQRHPNGTFAPDFGPPPDDAAPVEYCAVLRHFLANFLQHSPHARPAPTDERRKLVSTICMHPDAITAAALQNWAIGAQPGGGDSSSLIRGGTSTRLERLIGSTRHGNLWPAAAIWSLTRQPILVRAIQRQIVIRKRLLSHL